jgi:hypothetical protein
LLTTTVKPYISKDKKPNCFELVSIQKSFVLQADTKEEMGEWMEKIQEIIAGLLNSVTSVKEMVRQSMKSLVTFIIEITGC